MTSRFTYRDLIVYTISGVVSVVMLLLALSLWDGQSFLESASRAFNANKALAVFLSIPCFYIFGHSISAAERLLATNRFFQSLPHTILGVCARLCQAGNAPDGKMHKIAVDKAREISQNIVDSHSKTQGQHLREELKITEMSLRELSGYSIIDRLYVLSDLFKALTFSGFFATVIGILNLIWKCLNFEYWDVCILISLILLTFTFYHRAKKYSQDYVEELLLQRSKGNKA